MSLPCVSFALVVIENPSKKLFVLVHEKFDRGWWLPGGGVDANESFQQAAIREAKEEAGIDIQLTGILRVEYSLSSCAYGRLRIIFHAIPVDVSQPLKSIPDKESKEARWVSWEELCLISSGKAANTSDCYLRGPEPFHWFSYLTSKGPIFPLSTFQFLQKPSQAGSISQLQQPQVIGERALYSTTFTVALIVWNFDRTKFWLPAPSQTQKPNQIPAEVLRLPLPPQETLLSCAQRTLAVAGFEAAATTTIEGFYGIEYTQAKEPSASAAAATFSVVFYAYHNSATSENSSRSSGKWVPKERLQEFVNSAAVVEMALAQGGSRRSSSSSEPKVRRSRSCLPLTMLAREMDPVQMP